MPHKTTYWHIFEISSPLSRGNSVPPQIYTRGYTPAIFYLSSLTKSYKSSTRSSLVKIISKQWKITSRPVPRWNFFFWRGTSAWIIIPQTSGDVPAYLPGTYSLTKFPSQDFPALDISFFSPWWKAPTDLGTWPGRKISTLQHPWHFGKLMTSDTRSTNSPVNHWKKQSLLSL